jgi:K(+)-stimulated pyrophosphate-energized sodium pump
MGLGVTGTGILGLCVIYAIWEGLDQDDTRYLAGFGFGASSIALFARVGGGIYTKAADVGADLIGKVENDIPEDDPQNPAIIADNVGDNVGDVAGMGSDIFESYCGSMIASIAIAYTIKNTDMMMLPLALTSAGLLASIIGIFIVKLQSSKAPARALRSGCV